jgi:hypothetical protein
MLRKFYFSNFCIVTGIQHEVNFLSLGMATVGMFDWRLFDNSNRTKVLALDNETEIVDASIYS